MNRRTKIIVSVAGIFIVLLALLGLTYAYFLTRIHGNTNDKSISVSTAKLELTYSDNSSEILGSGKVLQPSNEPIGTKTFTVTNNGGDTNYSVVLENMNIKNISDNTETEFYSNDFVYTLTCTRKDNTPCGNQAVDETVLSLSDGALINNNIAASDVHTYILTLWYKETGLDQSADMNKTLSAKINIIDPSKENPYRNNKESLAYNIINNAINKTNGTEFKVTPLTVPAQEESSWEYVKTEDPTNFITNQTLSSSYYITYADDYTIDKKTGRFTLVNPTTVLYSSLEDNSILIGKYIKWGGTEAAAKVSSNLTMLYKATTNSSDITSNTIKCASISKGYKSTEQELSIAADDYGTSYYYRGGVTDNYLELNNMCFRIVRIQGDGSIKITLANNGPCSGSSSNSGLIKDDTGTNNKSVTYGYTETIVNGVTNYNFNYEGYTGTDGLYVTLNDWYSEKLLSVQDKLKDETWCLGDNIRPSDEQIDNQLKEEGYVYYNYETGTRLLYSSNLFATYNCSGEADKVNGYVGALLADEIAFAGMSGSINDSNRSNYLYDNAQTNYWSLSRSIFDTNADFAFHVWHSSDNALGNDSITTKYAVRPVITLKSGIELSSGDGTIGSPYTIK